jgi:hypothetical protein
MPQIYHGESGVAEIMGLPAASPAGLMLAAGGFEVSDPPKVVT